ncbi:Aldolase-type TIM barrel [Penicillium sp. IBT 31633x]|nr:Aldolase-type TIM barrel [Penicillium sp. IBT 31633x]
MAAIATAPATASASAVVPRVPIPAKGVDYRNTIVLAPMSMIGTERRVNPRNGTIEFTRMPSNGGRPDKPVKESIIYRLDPVREKGRLIFQMGTANPELAVQAGRVVAADVSGIDVNSGCPKPFSTHCGMGAALLRTPDLLVSILEALVKEVGEPFQIGISVKIRILSDPEETKTLVSRLVKTGITGLTVHCRTTPMRPRERAIRDQLRMVAGICHDAGVACVMNGDVTSRDQGLALMTEYGVDGAMIATSAESNSSCFRSEADGGLAPWRDIVHEYMRFCLEVENRMANTKYLLNMMIPGKNKEFKFATLSKTNLDLCRALKFEDLIPTAIRVDEVLGLDEKWAAAPGATDTEPKPETKSKAVQNAMESESARAAGGGAARVKTSAPAVHAGGPIRRTAAPQPAKVSKVDAEQPIVEATIPAAEPRSQSQVLV